MAALLRQGARRIGGSVLQRTQAAVRSPAIAEERRHLVPRRMYSAQEHEVKQQLKEELYESLSKEENWRNRRLLMDLAVYVNPRPNDIQWHRLRASKWASNVVRAVASVSFATAFAIGLNGVGRKVKSYVAEKNMIVKSYVAEKKMIAEALMQVKKEGE